MKKTIASAFVLICALSSSVMAAETYVTGTIGQSNLTGTILDKHTDTAFGLGFGCQFDKNFAAEVGYSNFGTFSKNTVRAKAGVLQASLVASYEVAPKVSVFARGGVAYTTLKVSGDFDGNGTHNKTTAFYGVGAQYQINPKLAATVELNQYNKFAVSNTNLNTLTVGVKYSF